MLLFSFCVKSESILVIESYHASYPWVSSYRQGLEEVLGDKFELTYVEMDTKRIAKSQFKEKANIAWLKYKELSPAAVIIADDNALQALAPRFLNTQTPIVYFGINDNPRKYGVVGATNFSGIIERPLLKRSILMLRKFLPVQKVLILFDDSNTGQIIVDDFFYGRDTMSIAGINIDIKQIESITEWKKTVLAADKQHYDAIFVGLYQTLTDEHGHHINAEEVIKWTSLNTKIPPIGFWAFSIGAEKNIGGYVISGYEEGKFAGDMAIDMIAGKGRRVMPQSGGHGRFIFSRTQLKKWNIQLPEMILESAEFIK
jgi:hypothetical protein